MPETDVFTKNYISQNEVFADVFNFFIYNGRRVVKPESLKDESPEESAIFFIDGKKTETAQRYRDVLKSCVIKRGKHASYVLLGVENQSKIHSAMPVKVAVYDMLQYDGQVRKITAEHRQGKDKMTSSEFLSGFTKEDRLIPVITLVIYFGSEKWDAPTSLYEMFVFNEENKDFMPFVQDCKINLIEPAALTDEELKKFVTDFSQVMKFLKYSNDKAKMRELLREDSSYENISTQAALVLNARAGIGIKINQKTEETNMCKAIQELQQEAVEEAVGMAVAEAVRKEREMQQEAIKENTVNSLLRTAKALMETLHLPAEQVLKAMKLSESECAALKPMLQTQ